ncbi:MAG: hypothetical protein RLZZ352_2530, partial [Pseudomonadota bacterium]
MDTLAQFRNCIQVNKTDLQGERVRERVGGGCEGGELGMLGKAETPNDVESQRGFGLVGLPD